MKTEPGIGLSHRTALRQSAILFGIPLLMIGVVIFVAQSPMLSTNPLPISIGVTVDLLVTIPFVHYLLLRWAKRSLITLMPFFVVGLVVGYAIVPLEHQQLLRLSRTWVLPLVELIVLAWVVVQVRNATNDHIQRETGAEDFFNGLNSVCARLLPRPLAVFVASEIAVVYYGFIAWKRNLSHLKEFTYHRSTSSRVLFATLIFLVFAETAILHLLLVRRSLTVAWMLTGFSIYAGVQIFGFMKSIALRPIVISPHQLHLRYGILREVVITREEIEFIEYTQHDPGSTDGYTRSLSPLYSFEGHNVVIHVRAERVLHGLYGFNCSFTTLKLHVDEIEDFKKEIESKLAAPFHGTK